MYVYKTCNQYLACQVEIHVDNSKQFPYTYGLHFDSRIETEISMQLIVVIYLPTTRMSLFLQAGTIIESVLWFCAKLNMAVSW